ncbi:coiled-coil domain-containing protein 185 [Thomomys bottae]
MADFRHFSPRPYRDLWESPPAGGERGSPGPLGGPEPGQDAWAGTLCAGCEAGASWHCPRGSPTLRPGRPGYITSAQESHSLTHVARRPPDRARKPRSVPRRLEDAWEESGMQSGVAWRPQRPPQPQPCSCYPSAQGDSPPPYPDRAYTPPCIRTFGKEKEKAQQEERWAVPMSTHVGCWSPSSVLTDRSSGSSLELRTKSACACAQKRDGDEGGRMESADSQCSQPSASSGHNHALKGKLEEAVMSSRDQKIVALVLTRLKKAQRMRELQQQAAVAWEELKRSDQKVQLTLEKERRQLLQQSQAQWQQQKEQRKSRQQPARRRDRPGKRTAATQGNKHAGVPGGGGGGGGGAWKAPTPPPEDQENQRLEKQERSRAQAEHRKQCQAQRLWEQERMLQRLRELNSLRFHKKLEEARCRRQMHVPESQKHVQEPTLSSLVNYQARKVLMDCQLKAEELLRKLSLEQSCEPSQETHQGLVKKKQPQERAQSVSKDEDPGKPATGRPQEEEVQTQLLKRMVLELAEQKIHHARCHAQKTTRDRAQHPREVNALRDKSHHILKLKAEKEQRYHIEGIKEAVKKREQRAAQTPHRQDPTLQDFHNFSSACRRDSGGGPSNGGFDPMAPEPPQLHEHKPRGDY